MTFDEKLEKYLAKNGREAFRTKTKFDELPIRLEYGSSSHHPEREVGITTSDIVLWVKFATLDWFRPLGMFDKTQIINMISICKNDVQIDALIELLNPNLR